jgi:hypothetical protein
VQETISLLSKRSRIAYGEDIPLDRVALVEWCITRVESWAKTTGMETFRDEGREGLTCLALGGKVLVVDVDCSIDKTQPLHPVIHVAAVKTSYAVPNESSGSSNTDGSPSLDAFLKESIEKFFVEVQKDEDLQNPLEAASLGSLILEYLRYLVMLDRLAERKSDGGIRWFVDIDQLCSILETFAKSEGEVVASYVFDVSLWLHIN